MKIINSLSNMKHFTSLFSFIIALFLISSCCVDDDFNNYDNSVIVKDVPTITGTWDATVTQYYINGEGYTQPGRGREYWIIDDNTITEYDKSDDTYYSNFRYTFDGKLLIIGENCVWEVVSITNTNMLLRKEIYNGMFQDTTFKRR